MDTFTCSRCKGTFTKAWSDEEAETERDELFPGYTFFELVCDDCFNAFWLTDESPN